MPQFGLTDAKRDALVALLRDVIAGDRFPLLPRIRRRLKTIIAKFEPSHVPPPGRTRRSEHQRASGHGADAEAALG